MGLTLNKLPPVILGNKKILGKSQNCMKTSPTVHTRFRNKSLMLVLKKYAKSNMKVLRFCLTLLDFLIFLAYFGTVLQHLIHVKKLLTVNTWN